MRPEVQAQAQAQVLEQKLLLQFRGYHQKRESSRVEGATRTATTAAES